MDCTALSPLVQGCLPIVSPGCVTNAPGAAYASVGVGRKRGRVQSAAPGVAAEHGGVARRGAGAQAAVPGADGAEPGLSISHIRPHSSKSLRVVKGQAIGQGWDDRPNRTLFPRGDGGLHARPSKNRVIEEPHSLVGVDGSRSSVEWYPDGSFVRVRKPSQYCVRSALPPVLSSRGSVSGFSRKSRCRLIQTLSQTRRAELPTFVTLTYPNEWPSDPRRWKVHLNRFVRRLRRRFPGVGAVWKLEPQQRGAPHYHLLVWIAGMTAAQSFALLRPWVARAWYECVASGDERHLRAGTRVEQIRSARGLLFYASKYFGKPVERDQYGEALADVPCAKLDVDESIPVVSSPVDAWDCPGRFWGVIGADNIPWAERLVGELDFHQACTLVRWLRRFRRANTKPGRRLRGRDVASMWGSVESPDTWLTNLERYG